MSRLVSVALALCIGVCATADETSTFDPFTLPGAPGDWSHRHQIFSAPGSFEQLKALQQEPRFWHQVYHRVHMPPRVPIIPDEGDSGGLWGESIPGGAVLGTVGPGHYPAKYSFNGAVAAAPCRPRRRH